MSILQDFTKEEYFKLRAKYNNNTEVAEHLFVSRSTLERWLYKNNIKNHNSKIPTMDTNKRITIYKELVAKGYKKKDIAKHLKFKTGNIVSNWSKKMKDKGLL